MSSPNDRSRLDYIITTIHGLICMHYSDLCLVSHHIQRHVYEIDDHCSDHYSDWKPQNQQSMSEYLDSFHHTNNNVLCSIYSHYCLTKVTIAGSMITHYCKLSQTIATLLHTIMNYPTLSHQFITEFTKGLQIH